MLFGRRTYIVQWTCEFIENNLHLLTEKDKNVIIRDIEQQIDYQELDTSIRWLGDKCDEEEWLKLLNILKEGVENGRKFKK